MPRVFQAPTLGTIGVGVDLRRRLAKRDASLTATEHPGLSVTCFRRGNRFRGG